MKFFDLLCKILLIRDYEDANSPKNLVLAGIADALAEKIDENARKSNLSAANVKSLLHVSVFWVFNSVAIRII